MRDVDWDNAPSQDTVNDWRALYFLAAQLIACSLSNYDDERSASEFDIVSDGPNLSYTNALRFRQVHNTSETKKVF